MKPYYENNGIAIYLGDCLTLLDSLPEIDLICTDPPYPDYHTTIYAQTDIQFLSAMACRQLVFWSAKVDFPLDYSGSIFGIKSQERARSMSGYMRGMDSDNIMSIATT